MILCALRGLYFPLNGQSCLQILILSPHDSDTQTWRVPVWPAVYTRRPLGPTFKVTTWIPIIRVYGTTFIHCLFFPLLQSLPLSNAHLLDWNCFLPQWSWLHRRRTYLIWCTQSINLLSALYVWYLRCGLCATGERTCQVKSHAGLYEAESCENLCTQDSLTFNSPFYAQPIIASASLARIRIFWVR